MDVRMPDGTVVTNVPDGTTRAELMRRMQGLQLPQQSAQQNEKLLAPPWEGKSFVPSDAPDTRSRLQVMNDQTKEMQAANNKDVPMIQRESFHDKSIVPIMTGMSMMIPGSGWGALALQSLGAATGGAAGEAIRRDVSRQPQDLKETLKVGATQGATNFVAGAAVKGLGALAKKLFSSPLSEPQQAAAQFARDEGTPFPLSSAAPGTGAARTQSIAGGVLPGAIKNQKDANAVAVFLNNRVGTLTEKANVFDDTAKQGQEFLRSVFEPGETAYKKAFGQFTESAGENAPVPIDNLKAAAQVAADRLKARGQTTGGLYQRLTTILKTDAQTMTPGELDELYGAVIKQAFNSRGAAGGEGKILLSGIAQDMDAFVPGTADQIATASAARDTYRELRNIPALQRLAADMKTQGGTKGTIDWMDTLFTAGNGKALSKLRELNPPLYHDLADAYLARQIDVASGYTKGGFTRQIDGQKLRSWFTANEAKIREIFGAPQAKALDNFTNYAAHMTGAQAAAVKEGVGMNLPTFGRAAAEVAATLKSPAIMVPGEAASFVLARGLSDPNSALFKAFTEGFSPGTRSFMVKAGSLAGRSEAQREQNQR